MSTRTFEKVKAHRLEKMRLGQAACEITELPSDPEIRIALVPLTDSEYLLALEFADRIEAGDNVAGYRVREEAQKQAVLLYSARELSDLTVKFFENIDEVGELMEHDVDHLYDVYLEMVANQSPSLFGLTDENFEQLKKVWQRIEWSELTGQQWYAAQRFLNSIQPLLHRANSFGSSSTKSLIETNSETTHADSAELDRTMISSEPA